MTRFSKGESASPAYNILDVMIREFLLRKATRIAIRIGDDKGLVQFDGKPMIELPVPVCLAMSRALKVLIGHDPQYYATEISGEFAFPYEGMDRRLELTINDAERTIVSGNAAPGQPVR
jgi:hypothetical protein